MELTINDTVYNFKFGIGFVRYLDGKSSINQNGMTFGIGLESLLSNLFNKNVVTLVDCLDTANRTEKPRVKTSDLEKYVESDDCDIEQLFDEVIDELKKSNATKLKTLQIIEEAQQANQNQAN